MSTPAALYRNAIDLNRYSNSVARRVINAYNDIIIDAADQLRRLLPDAGGTGPMTITAPDQAARLRSILAQLKESLGTWAGDATQLTATELQGLTELQSEFVTEQLRKVLPPGARDAVRTVEISPQFAQSVVTTDPTQLNVVALSDDLFEAVYGSEALARQAGTGAFSLTATKGTMITLPNGSTVEKAFRGIATDQAERFSQVVRNGLLTGETTPSIAKRLIGNLQFGEEAKTVRQLVAAGGELTAVADNQIMSLVRTSINQVANSASQQVYEANQDITKKYRYVATLDSRTSSICAALDGREFPYGKGPTPPQHFNCRSTTVPIIDPDILPPSTTAKRASADGPVPINTSYGQWLKDQPLKTQQDVLGPGKVPYFNRLVDKYGARDAMAKLVRDDGAELTLDELRKRYGPVKTKQPNPPNPTNKQPQDLTPKLKRQPQPAARIEPTPEWRIKGQQMNNAGAAIIKQYGQGMDGGRAVVERYKRVLPQLLARKKQVLADTTMSLRERNALLKKIESTLTGSYVRAQRGQQSMVSASKKIKALMIRRGLSKAEADLLTVNNSNLTFLDNGNSLIEAAKNKKRMLADAQEYARMFKGEGLKPSQGTQWAPAVKIIQQDIGDVRGFNVVGEGLVHIPIGERGKAVLFHEIGHTVEAQRPWLGRWAREWSKNKAYSANHPSLQKQVVENVLEGKPRYKLNDMIPFSGYNEQETAWADNYLSPYMGKQYTNDKGYISTEVWTMAMEQFATPDSMAGLYQKHPDLFRAVVGFFDVLP
jgi:SPP1 gp7 family putative phage head morphogenesis protein